MSKLRCEINDADTYEEVLGAACGFLDCPPEELQADYEHGQWWITHLITGAQWSACDAVAADAVDGFIFEQVTEGTQD